MAKIRGIGHYHQAVFWFTDVWTYFRTAKCVPGTGTGTEIET